MKTVKHYLVLGGYFAVVAFIVGLVRAAVSLPEKLREETWNVSSLQWWIDLGNAIFWVAATFGGLLLLGLGIGWLCHRLELDAEKRARASKEPLIVRR